MSGIVRCVAYLFLIVVGLFVTADAFHALSIWWRNRRWERTVTRDANGILTNAAPHTLDGTSDAAILFIHGFADTPETWQLLAPRVHGLTNVTCRVMRLPYISVPLRLQHHATLDNWLDAIRDEVARLRACHNKVFIAGHSLGAGLALLATRQTPGIADGVIVLAPLIRVPRRWGVSLDRLFNVVSPVLPFTRALHNHFPAVIKTKDGRVYDYKRDRFIALEIYRALFKMTRLLTAHGDVRPPKNVLAFLSLRDRVIDVPAALRYLEGAQIITTNEAGHVLTLDVGWEKRAEQIAEFVKTNKEPLP